MNKPGRLTIILFALALLIQIGILASFQFAHRQVLAEGRHFIARAVPVDPRDLFRGDYVTLRYTFSTVDKKKLGIHEQRPWKHGDAVYVMLRPVEPVSPDESMEEQPPVDWNPVAISGQPLESQDDGDIVLRGNVQSDNGSDVHVRYGIEAYFVPEGQGKDIEAAVQKNQLTVELSVSQTGQSQVATLLIHGEAVVFK